MLIYSRTDMLSLANTHLALYSAYLRRGQLPFEEAFARWKGKDGFQPHHVLLWAATVEISSGLLVDNGLAGRLAAGGYESLKASGAASGSWIGMARGIGEQGGETFLSGVPASMLSAVDAAPAGVLIWDLAGSLDRVLDRARAGEIDFPATLDAVIAADVRSDCGSRGVCPACGR